MIDFTQYSKTLSKKINRSFSIKQKKKILVISSRVPYPLIGGDRIRIFNFAKHLSNYYDIDLVALHDKAVDKKVLNELKTVFRNVYIFKFLRVRFLLNLVKTIFTFKPFQVSYYYFYSVKKFLDSILEQYDGVVANHIRTMEYVKDSSLPRFIDLHDALSLNYEITTKYISAFMKPFYKLERELVIRYENKAVNTFHEIFIVSDRDKEYLVKRGCQADKIRVIPVAVSSALLQYNETCEEKNQICFLGKMDYYPNIDAVEYFAHEIFPLVKAELPDTDFTIIGANPTKRVFKLKSIPGIHVTGWVEDPYKYLMQSKVVVALIRIGSGMQNKVLEAMAMGKPVVITSFVANSLKGIDGKHYIVADSPPEVSRQIISLLLDKQKRIDIGVAAKEWIRKNHTWDIIAEQFYRSIQTKLNNVT